MGQIFSESEGGSGTVNMGCKVVEEICGFVSLDGAVAFSEGKFDFLVGLDVFSDLVAGGGGIPET